MDNLWLVIVGMAAVTYIPRLLPLVMLDPAKLPPSVKNFLQFIPCAAISALIFPGIIESTGSVESALSGSVVALIFAYLGLNVIVVVFGGIAGVLLWDVLIAAI